MPKRAIVLGVKTAEERGPLSAWVFESREKLETISAEQVADTIGIHVSQIRKLEAGGPTYVASRRLQREVPALLLRLAKDRGIVLDPPPVPVEPPDQATDLVAAIRDQTRVMADLVVELRRQAEGQQAFLRELVATAVGQSARDRQDDPASPSPAGAAR